MAHKKGVGSSKNGRESESKRLGVKIFGGQFAKAGKQSTIPDTMSAWAKTTQSMP